nr:hypothetical protein [Angustibacter aerolatus]
MVSEIATLVWAAQMSTITVHPWPVRVPDVDRPDEPAHRPGPAAGPHVRRRRHRRGAAARA